MKRTLGWSWCFSCVALLGLLGHGVFAEEPACGAHEKNYAAEQLQSATDVNNKCLYRKEGKKYFDQAKQSMLAGLDAEAKPDCAKAEAAFRRVGELVDLASQKVYTLGQTCDQRSRCDDPDCDCDDNKKQEWCEQLEARDLIERAEESNQRCLLTLAGDSALQLAKGRYAVGERRSRSPQEADQARSAFQESREYALRATEKVLESSCNKSPNCHDPDCACDQTYRDCPEGPDAKTKCQGKPLPSRQCGR